MVRQSDSPPQRGRTYSRQTLRPLYCLGFVLPLLLLFHVGAAYYGSPLLAPRDVDRFLRFFGAAGAHLPALLIVAVLVFQHLLRNDRWDLQPKVLAGMTAESILWTVPLVGMGHLTGKVLVRASATATAPNIETALQKILTAVGAGIYEEFIFRLVLISVAMLILVDVFGLRKDIVAIIAVIVAAVLFSLYHFTGGPGGEVGGFAWTEFLFRAMAGVYLGGLYLLRGFGITVGVHAFFNIYVIFVHV